MWIRHISGSNDTFYKTTQKRTFIVTLDGRVWRVPPITTDLSSLLSANKPRDWWDLHIDRTYAGLNKDRNFLFKYALSMFERPVNTVSSNSTLSSLWRY
jgi:hypothetical protein